MSDDLIESIIDTGKIQKEIDFLKKNLDEMKATIMTFPVIKTDIGNAKNVKDLSKANVQLAESHKAVEQLVKARFASESKLVTLQTDYAKATAANNQELRKQNAELKAQAAYNAANTGSIEKARAAVKLLSAERDKLNLFTKEGQAQQAKLNEQIDKQNEFIRKSVDALGQQKINVGNYQGSAKLIVDALEKEKKKLEELEKTKIRVQNAGSSFSPSGTPAQRTTVTGFGGGGATAGLASGAKAATTEIENLNAEIEKSRTIVQGFSRITEQPQFLNVAGKIGDATAEIKFFTKALIDMERQGQGNSEAAIALRKNLAELTDQVGDAKAEIKALSSDTRSFDLFAGSVSFAADAFQTFAGAAVLAGASEEDAAEATKTLVAVQSVANGVKGIANELTTRGTAANKLYAFSQNQISIAMDATAATGARLRAVLATLGFGAVIVGIGLLITNFSKIKDALSGLTEAQKLNNEVTKKGAENSAEQVSQLTILVDRVKEGNLSFREKTKAVEDYNTAFGETLGTVKDYAELEKKLIESGADYIQYLQLKGNAEAAYQLAVEESKKAIIASAETDKISFAGKTLLALKYGDIFNKQGQYAKEVEATNKRLANNEVIDAREKGRQLLAIQQENLQKMNELANRLKLPVAGEDKTKPGKKKPAKETKEELDAVFEVYKIDQQRRIDFLKSDVDNEKKTNEERLNALQNYLVERLRMLNALQEHESIGADKKELLVIEANYNDERIRLFDEANKSLLGLQDTFGQDTVAKSKVIADKQLDVIKQFVKEQQEIDKQKAKDAEQAEKDLNKKKIDLAFQLGEELNSTLLQFATDNLDREVQLLDEKQRLLDEDTQRQINNINQLGLTEVERVKQTAAVEKNAQFQKEQIERKRRAIEVERAKFEKASNIAGIILNTAKAIMEAAPIVPLMVLIGTIGALQLAKAVSTPLPKYVKGTDSAKAGLALYGESGREIVIPKSGAAYLSPATPTLTSLVGGERIIPADMTANILSAAGMQRLTGMNSKQALSIDSEKIVFELENNTRAIKNLKNTFIIKNSHGIQTSAWFAYHFKY